MPDRRGSSLRDRMRADPGLLPTIQTRARVLSAIRQFFDQRDFMEVTTPCLVTAPDPAVHLDSFQTEFHSPDGSSSILYLATSPEHHMKRMVASGMGAIYQIGPFFRNGELGDLHGPEFTGLEWYQTGATVEQCMEFTERLVSYVAQKVLAGTTVEREGARVELKPPFYRMTVREALVDLGGVKVSEDFKDIQAALAQAGIHTDPGDSFDDMINRTLIERVEPRLIDLGPVFLYDYPAPMAALSRLRRDRPWVAERFELYAGGLELCNGYGELADAKEQRSRFVSQLQERRRLNKAVPPLDQAFLEALEEGLPTCSGCALGVDRLVMLICGKKRLRDVLAFPLQGERSIT